jgi:hypothetical protein
LQHSNQRPEQAFEREINLLPEMRNGSCTQHTALEKGNIKGDSKRSPYRQRSVASYPINTRFFEEEIVVLTVKCKTKTCFEERRVDSVAIVLGIASIDATYRSSTTTTKCCSRTTQHTT